MERAKRPSLRSNLRRKLRAFPMAIPKVRSSRIRSVRDSRVTTGCPRDDSGRKLRARTAHDSALSSCQSISFPFGNRPAILETAELNDVVAQN